MTYDDFAQHRAAIEQQVATILAGDRSSKLRTATLLLAIYCDKTGTLLAEAVRTTFGAVVVTYRSKDSAVMDIAPLTGDPAQTFCLAKARGLRFAPLTAGVLTARITEGAKKLTLLLPTTENNERLIVGSRADADPEVAAKAQRDRLRAAVCYRREHNHDPAQLEGTAEYLAQAEANLEKIRREHHQRERR